MHIVRHINTREMVGWMLTQKQMGANHIILCDQIKQLSTKIGNLQATQPVINIYICGLL